MNFETHSWEFEKHSWAFGINSWLSKKEKWTFQKDCTNTCVTDTGQRLCRCAGRTQASLVGLLGTVSVAVPGELEIVSVLFCRLKGIGRFGDLERTRGDNPKTELSCATNSMSVTSKDTSVNRGGVE